MRYCNRECTLLQVINQLLESNLLGPDLVAFRAVAASAASHVLTPQFPPSWLMLVGPSGCGKTTYLETLRKLENVWLISDITPKTLFSAWERKGKPDAGLMTRIGASGLILIKDFTTLMSQRQESKSEVFAQLREIYDGSYDKHSGLGSSIRWEGRATIIAACTPAVDRERMAFRMMGDRFLEVRLRPPDMKAVAKFVAVNRVMPDLPAIQQRYSQLVHDAVPTVLTEQLIDELADLSVWLAHARTPVEWDFTQSKVLDRFPTEAPTRVSQALMSITLTDAALRKTAPDLELARRIADDSVPPNRLAILKNATLDWQDASDIQEAARMSTTMFRRTLQELHTLHLVESDNAGIGEDANDALRLTARERWRAS